jgi:hypothetical protein
VYLSNCTDFFGLSSTSLEHACQELVSQHHCVQVLKAAWRTCNETLFKRACKFIDWSTLATLMNGGRAPIKAGNGSGPAAAAAQHDDADVEDMDIQDLDDEDDGDGEDPDDGAGGGEDDPADGEEDEAAAAAAEEAAALQDEQDGLPSDDGAPSASPPSARSRSSTGSAAAAAAAAAATASALARKESDVSMWKAIVAEKANPSAAGPVLFGSRQHSATLKRARAPEED